MYVCMYVCIYTEKLELHVQQVVEIVGCIFGTIQGMVNRVDFFFTGCFSLS